MTETLDTPADSDPARLLERGTLASAPRTLIDILRDTTARHPDASALEDARGALSYRELMANVVRVAARLVEDGVGRGDRVGVRLPSGSRELYIAILAVMAAGAAYVPVDVDDPDERADLVFREARVRGTLTADGWLEGPDGATRTRIFDGTVPHASTHSQPMLTPPTPDDDAWIIFTSGSTGTPKGVAVSHRSAAAFVDAEARLFLADEPIGPDDRVLAALSVAFDASCEEMWLAWRNGACLVPAPRSLVRTGSDLGPWLTTHGISIVSTVPTLASLWPDDSLENIRLLIFGGEVCPPELVARVAVPGREVWNTYGPTEATVVACAALLHAGEPVRIGLPLDGWDLAVIGDDGMPVRGDEVGELVIGGVGLARYLDPQKDAEKYATLPSLGWERAYRSGDRVRFDGEGLVFAGRVDDQVKIGGRRIELGEIEAALQKLPGVSAAAVAVQKTEAGNTVLVGYLAVADPQVFDHAGATRALRDELPAALVPVLAALNTLPTRTSGKVDRGALPWPLPAAEALPGGPERGDEADDLSPAEVLFRSVAADWQAVLGIPVSDADANFFDLGGGSLSAAQLVGRLRNHVPEYTVADLYDHPRLGALCDDLFERRADAAAEAAAHADAGGRARNSDHIVPPVPRSMQVFQTLAGLALHLVGGIRWTAIALGIATLLHAVDDLSNDTYFDALPAAPLWFVVPALLVFATPIGRMLLSVVVARVLLRGVRPGDHPRGGSVHRRLWFAEQMQTSIGAVSLAGAPWIVYYARALGAKIAPDVDLHTVPPVTGMLTIGRGASIEPEVDLSGYWIDGDVVRLGSIRIGAESSVGARSTLAPGTRLGRGAEVIAGSAVFGRVPAGQQWAGSPAVRVGRSRAWWPGARPPKRTRWVAAFGASSVALAGIPVLSFALGVAVLAWSITDAPDLAAVLLRALAGIVPATLAAGLLLAGLVVICVRLLSIGVTAGVHPVRSRVGWQVWSTERLLDLARSFLFPLYSSLFTPVWLRLLGADVGRNVEASTVLLVPSMTTVRDGAFLADDTLVASYELGGGWLRISPVVIGKRAFLGNSGMAGSGRNVPKGALVAVLSAAPRKSKPGTSWLGSPPVQLRRSAETGDQSRTYEPPARLRVARTVWELLRVVPVIVSALLGLLVIVALLAAADAGGVGLAILASPFVLTVAAALAAVVTSAAKWVLVGRIRESEHPLWSSFVWRTEVADTFVEMTAAPWFARLASGTPALVWWLRSLGSHIGRGVWCESYWLPEADLVTLGDGSTVNRGCVVQTHLFHDRIMSMDSVTLAAGSTLGPHSVILPAATIGSHATVGPASLVMRGETVPASSRWSGNPIGPWRDVTTADYRVVAP